MQKRLKLSIFIPDTDRVTQPQIQNTKSEQLRMIVASKNVPLQPLLHIQLLRMSVAVYRTQQQAASVKETHFLCKMSTFGVQTWYVPSIGSDIY